MPPVECVIHPFNPSPVPQASEFGPQALEPGSSEPQASAPRCRVQFPLADRARVIPSAAEGPAFSSGSNVGHRFSPGPCSGRGALSAGAFAFAVVRASLHRGKPARACSSPWPLRSGGLKTGRQAAGERSSLPERTAFVPAHHPQQHLTPLSLQCSYLYGNNSAPENNESSMTVAVRTVNQSLIITLD